MGLESCWVVKQIAMIIGGGGGGGGGVMQLRVS